MPRIQLLEGSIQHYDWGSRTALAELQGRAVPARRPEAELWLGAHRSGPARLCAEGGSLDLREWLAADPLGRLGARVVERFGPELPFLLKLLAVERPLSLQVHPDLHRAREGFEREEAARTPAFLRTYPDARHKPELVCALSPFQAFCGFRPWPVVRAGLCDAGLQDLPGIEALRARPGPAAGRALLAALLGLDPARGAALVEQAIDRLGAHTNDPAREWVERLARCTPETPPTSRRSSSSP